MLDLLSNLEHLSPLMIPLATFAIGILGSFHCVGMCGPLTIAFNKKRDDHILYQSGRLLGYILVGTTLFLLGSGFKMQIQSEMVVTFATVTLSSILVFYGLNILRSNHIHFSVPQWIALKSEALYSNGYRLAAGSKFMIGLFSIFLPCGLLYGLIAMILLNDSLELLLLSIITFWLGTLPSLFMAPVLFNKIFTPLKAKAPLLTALVLIGIGIAAILFRYYSTQSCCS